MSCCEQRDFSCLGKQPLGAGCLCVLCKAVSHNQCSCRQLALAVTPSAAAEKPCGTGRIPVWDRWPQAAAPGRISTAFKNQSTPLCFPNHLCRCRVPVSGWCSFGQVLAPGLLTFNAREGSLRHRFHRKLFISGSKAVYPRANKSGSTSLSLWAFYILL